MRKALCVLVLTAIAAAAGAQSVVCPTSPPELQRQCGESAQRWRELESAFETMEPVVNNASMLLVKAQPGPGPSFTIGGKTYPVRGRFQSEGALYIPLTQVECSQIFRSLYAGSRAEYERQMSSVRTNTMVVKQLLWQKLEAGKREYQTLTLFRAQCCGTRWTNDVGVEPARPAPTGPGLLGVPGLGN